MKSICLLTLLIFCLIKVISSATFSMNYPRPNTTYKTGDTVLIEWDSTQSNDTTEADELYATIALAYGQRNNLTICRVMTDRSKISLGYYQWIIPATVEPRSDYVIEVGTDTENIAFAGYITINRRNSSIVAAGTATTATADYGSVTHKALGLS